MHDPPGQLADEPPHVLGVVQPHRAACERAVGRREGPVADALGAQEGAKVVEVAGRWAWARREKGDGEVTHVQHDAVVLGEGAGLVSRPRG